ncbi:ATP-binding cassette domain-containing protein [Planctomicrobium sp. SH664]|uniref:ATP-binding cassette domain-containing protein n=1 Tax=Planctomicrobium sp. SH664 TaxID=3448125 RepID=UPI003F5CB886
MPAIITPLQRLVTRRSWSDRQGVTLIGWSLIWSLCALALLVLVTLFVDFLAVRDGTAEEILQAGVKQQLIPASDEIDRGLWVQAARFGSRTLWSWLPPLCAAVPLLGKTSGALAVLVAATLLVLILLSAARTLSRVTAARMARSTVTWLRGAIHRQTLRLGPSDLTGQRYQSALKLFIDEGETVRQALSEWRWRLTRAWAVLPTLVIAILAIDWRLGLECLVPTVACWLIYKYERANGARKREIAESHAETEVRFLSESLKQTRLVRGYNMEEFEQSLFARHLERMTSESQQGRRLERASLSTARFFTWLGLLLVLMLMSLRILSATDPLPLSNIVAMALALIWVAMELNSLEKVLLYRSEIDLSGDRIYRYLDEIPEVGQAVGAKFIQPVSKSVVFEAVRYTTQGSEILRGIDLRIEANTQIALVSLDPLQPRAVAYLLPRFIEPTSGRVLFDGEDIAWGTLESIRTETVYVGSDDPVLSGTVLDNLLCGDSRYSLPDAIEAAKLVHAHKFITRLPQGYDTVLGEHGEQLNVGEAFRLGLARAILRNPAILIIDEPQLLLDEDTKNLIDDTYQRIAPNRTLIFLPGRLSTIRRCDQVILLHEGRVEGIGSHTDLSKASALYRHWDYVTFNSFSRRARLFR